LGKGKNKMSQKIILTLSAKEKSALIVGLSNAIQLFSEYLNKSPLSARQQRQKGYEKQIKELQDLLYTLENPP
jgi:hypothetical protein